MNSTDNLLAQERDYSDTPAPGYVRVVEGGHARFERIPEVYEPQPEPTWLADLQVIAAFMLVFSVEMVAVFAYYGITLGDAIKCILNP